MAEYKIDTSELRKYCDVLRAGTEYCFLVPSIHRATRHISAYAPCLTAARSFRLI